MRGVISAKGSDYQSGNQSAWEKAARWCAGHKVFIGIVVVPLALLSIYLFLIASDQYESEAHFLVRTANNSGFAPATGFGAAISMVTGQGQGQNEALSVADFLLSHDAVDALTKNGKLIERFNRPGIDPLSSLGTNDPTPEKMLKYFRKQVKVHYDSETGITTLAVRAFSPSDSYELNRDLLVLGENQVNRLNMRSYKDAISNADRQILDAEHKLEQVQAQLTQYRQSRGDIDPEASGKTQINLVATLTGQLAVAKAQLNSMSGMVNSNSPQYIALAARVRALQNQVSNQSGKLTGKGDTIANNISGFEELQLRQQFLSKQYEAAAANLEKAQEEARRQQLYITRVVDANMPVKALYPERFRILFTAAVAVLLIYSIGWLIVAGVKEHAA